MIEGLDRLEQLDAVYALAEELIAQQGTNGDVRSRFFRECDVRKFSHVGSADRARVWEAACGNPSPKDPPRPTRSEV